MHPGQIYLRIQEIQENYNCIYVEPNLVLFFFFFEKDILAKNLSLLRGNPVRLNAPLQYPQFDRFKL